MYSGLLQNKKGIVARMTLEVCPGLNDTLTNTREWPDK